MIWLVVLGKLDILKLFDKFNKQADLLDKLFAGINNLASDIKTPIKKKITAKLWYHDDLGKSDNYVERKFDFGIKRIMRLKPDGAKYLLDSYYKHQSRIAEQHDFAE